LGRTREFAVRGNHGEERHGFDPCPSRIGPEADKGRSKPATSNRSFVSSVRRHDQVTRLIGCQRPSRQPEGRALLIFENVVLSFVPTVPTAVMIKTAMSAAISAYSIAVTPASSWANFFIDLNIALLPLQTLNQRPTRFPAARLSPKYPYPLSFGLIRFFTNDASENSVNCPFAMDPNPRIALREVNDVVRLGLLFGPGRQRRQNGARPVRLPRLRGSTDLVFQSQTQIFPNPAKLRQRKSTEVV
jgi:hypothetical protein